MTLVLSAMFMWLVRDTVMINFTNFVFVSINSAVFIIQTLKVLVLKIKKA